MGANGIGLSGAQEASGWFDWGWRVESGGEGRKGDRQVGLRSDRSSFGRGLLGPPSTWAFIQPRRYNKPQQFS